MLYLSLNFSVDRQTYGQPNTTNSTDRTSTYDYGMHIMIPCRDLGYTTEIGGQVFALYLDCRLWYEASNVQVTQQIISFANLIDGQA